MWAFSCSSLFILGHVSHLKFDLPVTFHQWSGMIRVSVTVTYFYPCGSRRECPSLSIRKQIVKHLDQSWSLCPPKLCNHFAEPSGTWSERYHATVTCTSCLTADEATSLTTNRFLRSIRMYFTKIPESLVEFGRLKPDIAPRHSCPRFKSSAASSFFSARSWRAHIPVRASHVTLTGNTLCTILRSLEILEQNMMSIFAKWQISGAKPSVNSKMYSKNR